MDQYTNSNITFNFTWKYLLFDFTIALVLCLLYEVLIVFFKYTVQLPQFNSDIFLSKMNIISYWIIAIISSFSSCKLSVNSIFKKFTINKENCSAISKNITIFLLIILLITATLTLKEMFDMKITVEKLKEFSIYYQDYENIKYSDFLKNIYPIEIILDIVAYSLLLLLKNKWLNNKVQH